MSIENAKAFYERMSTDEAFRNQYQNATTDDERRQFLMVAGYDFTSEEWQTAVAEISKSSDGELSNAELESVSGGILPGGCIPSKRPPVRPLYGAPIF
jgi:predicted ribosomally synthesized peptide with nif11-like leader